MFKLYSAIKGYWNVWPARATTVNPTPKPSTRNLGGPSLDPKAETGSREGAHWPRCYRVRVQGLEFRVQGLGTTNITQVRLVDKSQAEEKIGRDAYMGFIWPSEKIMMPFSLAIGILVIIITID